LAWYDVVYDAAADVLPPGCEDSVWIPHNQYVCPPGVHPGSLADEDNANPYPVAPPPEFVRVTGHMDGLEEYDPRQRPSAYPSQHHCFELCGRKGLWRALWASEPERFLNRRW
jgi:hypothetical protein